MLPPGGSGVLAPAGDGQFKLWEGGDAKAAAAFAQGQAPESLGLFLFSNLDKAVELPKEKTVFDVVDSVIEVPDAASVAASWLLHELLGHRYGGSSGTNLIACLQLASAERQYRQPAV